LVREATHDLVPELAIDRERALGDVVGYRREWLGELHRSEGGIVEDHRSGGVHQLDVLEPSVLGNVEFNQELALASGLLIIENHVAAVTTRQVSRSAMRY
jgi:hypothetical protein